MADHEPVPSCLVGGPGTVVVQAEEGPVVQALALAPAPAKMHCHAEGEGYAPARTDAASLATRSGSATASIWTILPLAMVKANTA